MFIENNGVFVAALIIAGILGHVVGRGIAAYSSEDSCHQTEAFSETQKLVQELVVEVQLLKGRVDMQEKENARD